MWTGRTPGGDPGKHSGRNMEDRHLTLVAHVSGPTVPSPPHANLHPIREAYAPFAKKEGDSWVALLV